MKKFSSLTVEPAAMLCVAAVTREAQCVAGKRRPGQQTLNDGAISSRGPRRSLYRNDQCEEAYSELGRILNPGTRDRSTLLDRLLELRPPPRPLMLVRTVQSGDMKRCSCSGRRQSRVGMRQKAVSGRPVDVG